jgi:ubiquinone/menaquinone biosynthesis C-methylase UbiE
MTPSGTRARAQKVAWRVIYGLANRRAADPGSAFMNYGYAPLDEVDGNGGGGTRPSVASDDPERFGIALYDAVARGADLVGRDVLEVGCGRGGGTAFVFDQHRPRSMAGVDLSQRAIVRCRADHPRPGLRFVRGDAEKLPFADASFDAVLNVESCHCYPDVPRFLDEVHRVLRPGGVLLLADVRHTRVETSDGVRLLQQEDVTRFREHIERSRFEVLEEEDITSNVLRALELDSARRRAHVESRMPRRMQAQALELAAVEGTRMFEAYRRGDETYLRFALQRA